jgi:cellulose synthase operon protein C
MTCRPERHFTWVAAAGLLLGATAAAVPERDGRSEALAALARGDGIAAEIAARRALDAGAPRSEVAALIGEAELLQGDYGDARSWLMPGEFSASTGERGFHALGRLELEEGDLAAATRAFDRALVYTGGSAGLWVDIGRLRYLSGQHHLALEAVSRAIAIDPGEPRALQFQAQLTRDAQGVVAALPWFERALAKAPGDIGLLGEYAATLGEAGRSREMLKVARRMVELDPRHPRAYYLQAVLAARAGRDDLAERLLARTNGAYDDMPAGLLLSGILELRTGNTGLAVDRLDELARQQPDNETAQLLVGRALLAHGEANEVVARFQVAADRPDASPYLLALVGRAYEQMEQRADAARYLDRAAGEATGTMGTLPSDAPLSFAGAEIDVPRIRQELAHGRLGVARSLAAELAASYPDSIDVEILVADVALATGDPASALAGYASAAAVRRDFSLVQRMAAAQQELGRDAAAVSVVAEFLEQNPRSAAAAALLGRMMAERGDRAGARLLLAHARDLGMGDARLLSDLAEAELAGGDVEAAGTAARRAYALHRSNGRVTATLARVLRAGGGNSRQAQALLDKAGKLSQATALARR